jgi:hypothetical protein
VARFFFDRECFISNRFFLGLNSCRKARSKPLPPLPWLLGWCRSATAPYLLIISSRSSLSLLCFTLFTPHPPHAACSITA